MKKLYYYVYFLFLSVDCTLEESLQKFVWFLDLSLRRVGLIVFLFQVFLVKVFSLKVFLGELSIKYFFRKHYKWFSNTTSDLSNF